MGQARVVPGLFDCEIRRHSYRYEFSSDYVQGSGLQEAWIESSIFGPGTAEQVMSGKSYGRVMRGHKLTLQALWQLLISKLLMFIKDTDQDLERQIQERLSSDGIDELIRLLALQSFNKAMDSFLP